ncbi:MAG: hypothetical protein U1F36_11280 [Planctomycetota bacterium]
MSRASADAVYLRRLHHDVVNRPPSPAELGALQGMPLDRVSKQVWRRREAMEEWLEEELYFYLLIDRFRPRTPAIEDLPDRLARGRASARDATAEILLSTGFSLRNPGNDTFVTVVLEQCLGMKVQERKGAAELEAGKQMYDGRTAKLCGQEGSSQSDIVRIALGQDAFRARLLDRHHQRFFGRPMKSRGDKFVADTVAALRGDEAGFFATLAEWTASDEYLEATRTRKARTQRQLVRALYFDVLERAPDYEEMRNMRNALQSMADPTPLRAVLAKLLLDAKAAKLPGLERGKEAEYVRQCFLRYLGREPTQGEASRYTETLRDPEADPKLVPRALLGSVEYGYC